MNPGLRGGMRWGCVQALLLLAFMLLAPAANAQRITSWWPVEIRIAGGGTLKYEMARVDCISSGNDYLMEQYKNISYTFPSGSVSRISPINMSPGSGADGICSPNYGKTNPLRLDFYSSSGQENGNVSLDYVRQSAVLLPPSGYLLPKYQVVGIDFAPPGANSNVNYGKSTMRGTSTSISSSWGSNRSVTASISSSATLFGILKVGSSVSSTSAYGQTRDRTNTIAIGTTGTATDVIPGPLSSADGISHDYDVIWVWLNPAVKLTLKDQTNISWDGYAYNREDDANQMEVVPIYVIQLKNPSLIPPGLAARLARTWDTSGVGGLNADDYAAILRVNPFVENPSYDPNTDPNRRFDIQNSQTFNYTPPPPGGQPITQTYTLTSQATSSAGQGASHSNSVATTTDSSVGISIPVFSASLGLKTSSTYTYTDNWSSSINSGSGQSASLSITGPAASDNYTGPTTIQVWRDNIYGSFMFYGVR